MLKAGIREFFAESEEIMRKERRWKKVLSALVLAAAMGVTAVGCGTSGGNTGSQPQGENAAATETAEVSDDIVNIGVTNTLGTLNPLLMDGGETNKYATKILSCISMRKHPGRMARRSRRMMSYTRHCA